MITANRDELLYTIELAAKVLHTFPKSIVKITVLWKVVCVVVKGKRATFVSKKRFHQAFVSHIKGQAVGAGIWVKYSDTSYNVRCITDQGCNSVVTLIGNQIRCTCGDYNTMQAALGDNVVCQHGYAVLNILGHQSLQSYLQSR